VQQTEDGRPRALLDAEIAVSPELSINAVLQRIVEASAELTGAAYAALGVIDQREVRRHRPRRGDARGDRRPTWPIHAVWVMPRRDRRVSMDSTPAGGPMTDATTEFFSALEARRHEPLLENERGTLRFDLTSGKRTTRWLIEIEDGDVSISHRNSKADCVVRTKKSLFDGIASGQQNAMAAVLRGEVGIEGDRTLLVRFQKLFPSPERQSS
jgi:putative sterol carrier protein